MGRPDGGMYGIKLTGKGHVGPKNWPCYYTICKEGDAKRALMNFNNERNAASMPEGHRALVYITGWKKFIWEVEFLEVVEPAEYEMRLLKPWGMTLASLGNTWRFVRPIRFLARTDEGNNYAGAPTLGWARKLLGKPDWQPTYGKGHGFIDKVLFDKLLGNITWAWRGDGEAPVAPVEPQRVHLPPVSGIEAVLSHLKAIEGKPERNMEDVVKEFLLLLGHSANRIEFQTGRIDVRVLDGSGRTWCVLEVKRSLADKKNEDRARRQAFDYANKVGARIVVLTDADVYVIYDRKKGDDYGSQFCGRFRLTDYKASDEAILNLLRPRS